MNSNKRFEVRCIDGAAGLMELPDKSVKLIYGSPPYPNPTETMECGKLLSILTK